MHSPRTDSALDRLKRFLLDLRPAGPSGFEGLACGALADLTGLTFRLARSGLQNGRDAASSPSSDYAIGFEAKLYSGDIRTEDLAGKSVLAGIFMGGAVDVWAVGTTAEIGEQTISTLVPALEEQGVTLLALDWTDRPLPVLAVLLASAKASVLGWFGAHAAAVSAPGLEACLDDIRADADFAGQSADLKASLSGATVGLDALRERSGAWLLERFSTPILSQQAFGQRLSVCTSGRPVMPRTALVEELDALIQRHPSEPTIVALLGGEGAGKTWLAAQWWVSRRDRPILILIAGRRMDLLDPGDPLSSLAGLLAQQDGRSDAAAIESWKRRLRRWKSFPSSTVRFVVIIDGLNERTHLPWADLVRGLSLEAASLGGLIIATCRASFWNREVAPKLSGVVTPRTMTVTEYTDGELKVQLAAAGRNLDEIPTKVRDFIRNPRVCALAVALLDRLSPAAMSIEGLLFEYWRARLEDRGDGLRHSIADFHKLLRAHAHAWRAAPGVQFSRDDWATYSGAARRLGARDVADDLTEIEEGRFLTIDPSDAETYSFRPEALPFALALLIVDELKTAVRLEPDFGQEALDRIIDPVAGFDRLADILGAAVWLSCADPTFPVAVRTALIASWGALQNQSFEGMRGISPAILVQPDAFLAVVELAEDDLPSGFRSDELVDAVIELRDDAGVRDAVAKRASAWLGAWSRMPRSTWGETAGQRESRRDAWISSRIATVSGDEADWIARLTTETPRPASTPLDGAVAHFIAGRAQAEFASGLVGWAVAQSLARDSPNGEADLQWAVRLNRIDWCETRMGVFNVLGAPTGAEAPVLTAARALALRILGDDASGQAADALEPIPSVQPKPRRRALPADVDPLEPNAGEPSDLGAERAILAKLIPSDMWTSMSTTADDLSLDDVIVQLVRFDPGPVVDLFRRLALQARSRSGMAIRQLSWHLPWIAPLLTEAERHALEAALDRVRADPSQCPGDDHRFVVGQLVSSLLPLLDADEQFDLVKGLPPGFPLWLHLRQGVKSLDPVRLEERLIEAETGGYSDLTRALFIVGGSRPVLTPRSAAIVAEAVFHDDDTLSSCAAEVAFRACDGVLNRLLLEAIASRSPLPLGDTSFSVSRAIAAAIVSERRSDLASLVAPRFADSVAFALGGRSLDHLAVQMEAVVSRLLEPVTAQPPQGVEIYYGASEDGMDVSIWAEAVPDRQPDDDPLAALQALSDVEGSARRHQSDWRAMMDAVKAYHAALTVEQAAAIASKPGGKGLRRLSENRPALVQEWLTRVLAAPNGRVMAQLKNLALALASAHASRAPDLASAVFDRFWSVSPVTNLVIDLARLPFDIRALFGAGPVSALDALRNRLFDEAMSDAELEDLVVTAEAVGATAWLDSYVTACLAKPEPGAQARAMMVAGLRGGNAQSDAVLGHPHHGPFLTTVRREAREAYVRAAQADTWMTEWGQAATGLDFWRSAQLLEQTADRRALVALDRLALEGPLMTAFAGEVFSRLKKAVEKRSKARSDTLFGLKRPSDSMIKRLAT